MQKLQADNLTGVSETLLIPLHYRVEESRAGSGSYKDDMAERFHDAIAYQWEKIRVVRFNGQRWPPGRSGILWTIRSQLLSQTIPMQSL